MTSCRTETETVSRMQKAWLPRLLLQAVITEWRRRLSAHVSAHGGHFEHILRCFRGSVHVLSRC